MPKGFLHSGTKLAPAVQKSHLKSVVSHLAAHGSDRRYGARPLQRMIEQQVIVPLSRFLIENVPSQGASLRLDMKDGSIAIFGARPQAGS
jgi:ATP-dependent Clp protease ATP-binding subunit ClpC